MSKSTNSPGSISSLRELFAQLSDAPLPSGEAICALPIPGFETHRLGRNSSGAVCLLISIPQPAATTRPDVSLQNLRVQRRIRCDIVQPTGQRETLSGTIVYCASESQDLRGFFLDLFGEALGTFGGRPLEQDVDWWIDQATSLFAELEIPTANEVRGLWGELLVIAEARDPTVLVRRWHESTDERFDFMSGSFALEAKTCRDEERIHLFALAQIRPRENIDVAIASVPLYPDPSGTSVLDLLAEVESRVADRAAIGKFRHVLFRSGGSSLSQSPQRFDRVAASRGLRFMWASTIPAIEHDLSNEILDVQLRIRCCDIPGADLRDMISERLR